MARNMTSKFGVAEGLDFIHEHTITEIPIDKLIPYKHHRFKLYEGERLDDMVQSIQKNGVITPIIVRTMDNDKYEILSGHNRVYASGIAGMKRVPAYIKVNLSDEDAEIVVVDTNLIQRSISDLRISEQAYAISLRYGKLFDERKLKGIDEELYMLENGKPKPQEENGSAEYITTRVKTAEEYGISQATVARLLRINTLTDELKELVDKKNIAIRTAVDLSYLSTEHQNMLYRLMCEMQITVIDMKTAKQLREVVSSYANVEESHFREVLNGEYGNEDKPKKEKCEKIMFPKAAYTRYLSKYPKNEVNSIIEKALAFYFENTESEEE